MKIFKFIIFGILTFSLNSWGVNHDSIGPVYTPKALGAYSLNIRSFRGMPGFCSSCDQYRVSEGTPGVDLLEYHSHQIFNNVGRKKSRSID